MALQIYISGKFYDKENAKVSVYDHGLLYGDGIFEGMRSYSGRVFRLEEHLRRLYDSAQAIWLKIPIDRQAMADAVYETLKVNNLVDAYIRLVVTRGAGTLGLDPNKCSNPQVIIIADHIALYPPGSTIKGWRSSPSARFAITRRPSAAIKSLNYLNNILAKIEGLKAGCVEALMLIPERSANAGDNILLVRDGMLHSAGRRRHSRRVTRGRDGRLAKAGSAGSSVDQVRRVRGRRVS